MPGEKGEISSATPGGHTNISAFRGKWLEGGPYQGRRRVKKTEFRPPHPAGTQIFPSSGENGLKGAVPEAVPGEKGGISSAIPVGHTNISDYWRTKVHRQLNG